MLKKMIAICLLALFALSSQAVQAADTGKIKFDDKFGKVLIVYFTNSGNTKLMADLIWQYTGGEVYELKTVKPYPAIPELYQYAKQQLEPGGLPELESDWPDFSQYDVIFVGGPVWWYTLCPPLLSFLTQADFKGKAVVPFCTHGGNYGAFFKRFSEDAKNAQVLKGLDFYRPLATSKGFLKSKLANWLSGMDLPAR